MIIKPDINTTKDKESKKTYVVVYKDVNPIVNISIEHLLNYYAYKYGYDVASTDKFIISRIPSHRGDTRISDEFINKIGIVYPDESSRIPFEELDKRVSKIIGDDFDLGFDLIREALKISMMEFDIIEDLNL